MIRDIVDVVLDDMLTPEIILDQPGFQDLIEKMGGRKNVSSTIGLIHALKLRAFAGSNAAANTLFRLKGAFVEDKVKSKLSGYRKPMDEYEDGDIMEMAERMGLSDMIEDIDFEEVDDTPKISSPNNKTPVKRKATVKKKTPVKSKSTTKSKK